MENFDFYIKYYTFNGPTKQAKKINLREIINLFIAEGLYKYQVKFKFLDKLREFKGKLI